MGNYKSLYTGDEHDLAVSKVLGGRYYESVDPGCHLIGTESANPQNLFEILIPGKYTVIFYYDMDSSGNAIFMPFAGNSPIFIQVSYEGDHHYQRITIGASLYYRDLASGDYTWICVDMGVQKTKVIDHLRSTETDAALSANMGRELKSIIDGLEIGNMNLIHNGALMRGSEGWNLSNGDITRDPLNKFIEKPTFKLNGSALSSSSDFLSVATLSAYDAPVIPGAQYTASIWVKTESVDAKVYVQITYVDESHATVDGKKYECTVQPSAQWTKLTVTYRNDKELTKYAKLLFGVSNNAIAHFALPKLEQGVYATQWMPSYFDMWSEFDNANFLNEIFLDIEDIKGHQGIIYDESQSKFVNEYLAVGGGGGFVQSRTEPENHEVLWFNLSDFDGKFYRYNNDTLNWVKALPPIFTQQNTSPADIEKAWLDNQEESDSKPATLKYYDLNRRAWRAIGAAPGVNWVFSPTPPADTGLMWIQTPQMVLKFYYDGAWVPIHAIWGANTTT